MKPVCGVRQLAVRLITRPFYSTLWHAAEAAATETVMLDVSGMKCGGCSASVKRILLSNEGVQHAAVNLLTETAVVKLRPAEGSAEKAAELLTTKVGPVIDHPPPPPPLDGICKVR